MQSSLGLLSPLDLESLPPKAQTVVTRPTKGDGIRSEEEIKLRFSKSILVTALALASPFITRATTVKSNPTLTIGNLTFSNFTCDVTKGGSFVTPGGCGKINVSTITDPGTGIQFSSGWTAFHNSFDDAVINYHVSSTSGIDTIGLDFNGIFEGYAVSSVTESVYAGGKLVGFAEVACGTDPIGCERSDSIKLDGTYKNLYVQKDINVTAWTGLAQISYVDQTFADAPEPTSMALFGSGLIGVVSLLRRRAKSQKEAAQAS
jgi:PEP-CTERM motif